MISFIDFPFPPSENALYRNVSHGGKSFRALTAKGRQYIQDVNSWAIANSGVVSIALRSLSLHANDELRLDITLFSPKWYTKANSIRRTDVTNYQKALIDQLCRTLEIDDSRFFVVTCVKNYDKKSFAEIEIGVL